MEIFELRYFAAVAETENIHKAADKLHISGSALSKAISRLEAELNVNLFEREGRNIKLTLEGKKLQDQCLRFFELEAETVAFVAGKSAQIEVRIAGPEVFLSNYGIDVTIEIRKEFPNATFRFLVMSEDDAQNSVVRRMADICLVTDQTGKSDQLKYKVLEKLSFATYVGESHPLSKKKSVNVADALAYDFLLPSESLLGKVRAGSSDGWRDDKFLRKIRFKDVGLKTIENLIVRGQAIAYLPTYFAESLPVKRLEISGCPYTCEQKIMVAAKDYWSKYFLKN